MGIIDKCLFPDTYRDYKGLFHKTQIGSSLILQCTGTIKAYFIKHRLAILSSYSVQGL